MVLAATAWAAAVSARPTIPAALPVASDEQLDDSTVTEISGP